MSIYPITPPFQMSSHRQSQKTIKIIGDQYVPHKHTLFQSLTVFEYGNDDEGTIFSVQVEKSNAFLKFTEVKKAYDHKKKVLNLPFQRHWLPQWSALQTVWFCKEHMSEEDVQSKLDDIYYIETKNGNFWNKVHQ